MWNELNSNTNSFQTRMRFFSYVKVQGLKAILIRMLSNHESGFYYPKALSYICQVLIRLLSNHESILIVHCLELFWNWILILIRSNHEWLLRGICVPQEDASNPYKVQSPYLIVFMVILGLKNSIELNYLINPNKGIIHIILWVCQVLTYQNLCLIITKSG